MMKRAAPIAGLLAAGAVLIVAASLFAGRVTPRGYCAAIGREIAELEAQAARGAELTRHERGYLQHWRTEAAQRCGAPTPGARPRVLYL